MCPPGKVPTVPEFIETKTNYKVTNVEQKFKREKRIMGELLQEAVLMKALKKYGDNFRIPGEDEFTIGLVKMIISRKIPIWLVNIFLKWPHFVPGLMC